MKKPCGLADICKHSDTNILCSRTYRRECFSCCGIKVAIRDINSLPDEEHRIRQYEMRLKSILGDKFDIDTLKGSATVRA